VEYASFHTYKRSCEDVQFLGKRIASTGMGETPWRTSAEAADAGAGNHDEAEWNENSKRTRGRVMETLAEDQDEHDKSGSSELAQVQEEEGTPRKKARKSRDFGRNDSMQRYPELSSATQCPSDQSGKSQAETLEYLTRRVSALEHANNDGPDRAIRQFVKTVQTKKCRYKSSNRFGPSHPSIRMGKA